MCCGSTLGMGQWGYFSNTVVYAFQKPDHVEHFVIFWNLVSNEVGRSDPWTVLPL